MVTLVLVCRFLVRTLSFAKIEVFFRYISRLWRIFKIFFIVISGEYRLIGASCLYDGTCGMG